MSEMVELSPKECLERLVRGGVGRLAFLTPHGLRIVPLNFDTNPDVVVLRTEPDSELGRYGEGAEAAFEIDGTDAKTGQAWSVVPSVCSSGRRGQTRCGTSVGGATPRHGQAATVPST